MPRMSYKDLRLLAEKEKEKAPKTPKYKNRVCDYRFPDGSVMRFDSEKERDRFAELHILERAGQISGLECQKEYMLIPSLTRDDGKKERACKYIADFVYTEDGKTIVEDVKGYRDPKSAGYAKFVIKRKLMLEKYGITIREV